MIKKILLLMFLPFTLFAWKMESGTVSLPATTAGSSMWQTVTLQQTYDTVPLIFALPDDGNGSYSSDDSPAALRVRNIDESSFEIVQVEPQSNEIGEVEGEHAAMTIHYIAIESGDHILPDGTRIVADSHDTTTKEGKNVSDPRGVDNISFSPVFSSTPVMLNMIQSIENEDNTLPGASSSPWMTAHIDGVDSSGFNITLDRAETSSGSIDSNETIGYLAIDSASSGTIYDTACQSVSYQTINTGDNVQGWSNGCYPQSFGTTYASAPNVLGSMQSRDGADGGWLRRCSLSNSAVGITVDEDQAADSDRSHTDETVGLVIFSQDFVYDSTFNLISCGLVAEYRMDECYWLNSSATPGDVKDNSKGLHGTSSGTVQPVVDAQLGRSSGYFTAQGGISDGFVSTDNDSNFTFADQFTISTWIDADVLGDDWSIIAAKFSSQNWTDGWGLFHWGDPAHTDKIGFIVFVSTNYYYIEADIVLNQWTHIVGRYDGSTIKLYVDGVEISSANVTGNIDNTTATFDIGAGKTGNGTNEPFEGKIDELKIWNRALSSVEIENIEGNESIGNNYDGTSREPVTCDAIIAADSWELVGIPIDLRTDPQTVSETFQGISGVYGTDWSVYRRDYSDTDNSSWYTYLDSTDSVDFGKGYWLGNKQSAQNWNVNGTQAVDYDSSHPGCPANQCVEIDVKSVSVDFTTEPDDGTGPYRYNMIGFTGKSPVAWADCRFIIDGTAYTPTAAESAGYASKVIWQYNPGDSGADSNGYTVCEDSIGTCLLEPYKGFWLELRELSKDKTIKLLIPQE